MGFYSSGHIILYFYRLGIIKSIQLTKIKENNLSEDLNILKIIIPDSNSREVEILDDREEVRFKGKMYDVITETRNGDTTVIFVVYDDTENLLNESYAKLTVFQKDFHSDSFQFNFLSDGNLKYLPNSVQDIFYNPQLLYKIKDNPLKLQEVFLAEDIPPPRSII
jgi:hypothetical protein